MKRVLSYGAGVDSWAMLLHAVETGAPPDAVVFADVGGGSAARDSGDPGEWPGTYAHLREVVLPYCAAHGVPFHWLDGAAWPVRDATSLYGWLKARQQIPMAGPNRICTAIAKVERVERWCKATFPGEQVEMWIGFEAGEEARAAKDPNAGKPAAWRVNRFPLIELGWCRCRCVAYIQACSQPVPPKSACTFCPYASRGDWKLLRARVPRDFAAAVQLERAKPPTKKNGLKLSIMGYSTRQKKLAQAEGRSYVPETLEQWTSKPYNPRPLPCEVCGAPQRASKATGCGYAEAA